MAKVGTFAPFSEAHTNIGVVIRDNSCTVKVVVAQPLQLSSVLEQWRHERLFRTFIWVQHWLLVFVVELDSQSICHKIHANKLDLSPVRNFIRTIRDSLSSSLDNLVTLKYVSRSVNAVTDSLTHMDSTFSAH
ncbi:hypothetical protein M9H77_34116 [Catharanthus roseus]|uniref:Uncharacterized protein n=1 Tax=Catharanthus roseus TaxID=4058 RepID=A0ACB9ZK74_CATRO|nr:hypothetical protein M9H77_34116 [Catharanthus roseus]